MADLKVTKIQYADPLDDKDYRDKRIIELLEQIANNTKKV